MLKPTKFKCLRVNKQENSATATFVILDKNKKGTNSGQIKVTKHVQLTSTDPNELDFEPGKEYTLTIQ